MNDTEKSGLADNYERFAKNYAWFNEFFADLKSLFEKVNAALSKAYPSVTEMLFYYPKSTSVPGLPPYYVLCRGGKEIAIQVYAILDATGLEIQNDFERALSFVVVEHSKGDRWGYVEDYGLAIIGSPQKGQKKSSGVISGVIAKGGAKGTYFHAFQVPLACFIGSGSVDMTIKEQIVDRLTALPKW